MEGLKHKLLFHLKRSQQAYKAYVGEKKYYQALRIFQANQAIYILLPEGAGKYGAHEEAIITYMFHLEDWFQQFLQLQGKINPALEDEFVFLRLEGAPAFPSDIEKILNSLS